MSDSLIHSSINAGVLTLTITRPEALNALNAAVISELAEAVGRANATRRPSHRPHWKR